MEHVGSVGGVVVGVGGVVMGLDSLQPQPQRRLRALQEFTDPKASEDFETKKNQRPVRRKSQQESNMLDPKEQTRVRHRRARQRGPASWEPAQLGGGSDACCTRLLKARMFAAKLTGAALNPTFSFVPVPLAGYPA